MHTAFYSCEENAEMIEKMKIFGVDPITKARMDVHYLMCKRCRSYKKHSDYIDLIAYEYADLHSLKINTSQLKKNILDKIKGTV